MYCHPHPHSLSLETLPPSPASTRSSVFFRYYEGVSDRILNLSQGSVEDVLQHGLSCSDVEETLPEWVVVVAQPPTSG